MLRINLRRKGRKNRPFFEIIVKENLANIKGKYLEKIGYFDIKNNKFLKIDINRINYFISRGAKPSKTIIHLIKKKIDN